MIKMQMRQLAKNDPQAHRQLVALWKADPHAAMEFFKAYDSKQKLKTWLDSTPQLRATFENMNEEMQAMAIASFTEIIMPPLPPPGGERDNDNDRNPRHRRHDARDDLIAEIRAEYPNASDEDIKSMIVERLGARFNAQTTYMTQRMEQFEKQLNDLKRQLEYREKSRDDILEKQLQQLYSTDNQ